MKKRVFRERRYGNVTLSNKTLKKKSSVKLTNTAKKKKSVKK